MSKIANPTKVITGVNTRRSYANVWDPKSINGAAPKYSVCRSSPYRRPPPTSVKGAAVVYPKASAFVFILKMISCRVRSLPTRRFCAPTWRRSFCR